MDHQGRRARFLAKMAQAGRAAAMIITNYENRRYFSGFSGSFGYLLMTPSRTVLLTDSRYTQQAQEEAPDILHKKVGGLTAIAELAKLLQDVDDGPIGFDGRLADYPTYVALAAQFGADRLVDLSDMVDAQRGVKDADEIALLAQAEAIGDAAFQVACERMRAGMTEVEVALILETEMRRRGAQSTSFDTIVASGARGALPHGLASGKKMAEGDLVVMDFGCKFNGYCSDMTRTVAIGQPSAGLQDLYALVLKAQKACLDAARAGVIGAEVHQIAVDLFSDAGMGAYFGHGLGHSVGLEIHEKPVFSPAQQSALPAGTVITVEPGLYLPGQGGVRIEDVIALTDDGCLNLTHSPKELLIL